ncbi:MAG TPA: dephospho-CoA kinase [Plasticicumulans sp.]|uniref:dephospho-CoA kinase n=1 Tax=Plasticicumulans sp. TaxID=2307179 RepID=UPI002C7BBF34|nr:dephospho-CoA kinase [Plasticicumulans sp.]MBS0600528.1 dephospho-CoA kinase [Pseudomonadota bacterium]HMV37546.1 dephospho-CoA kinase [Plasticicumulans sp.]HMW28211.1 dephospho-CoA kinase [Plasticicumulans sp.]HMW40900.1 dephospho-CoA kinase [Plasticicumulans sp.]HND99006.1 dephospho-CoA kinase [Plasticicumulans sp.]
MNARQPWVLGLTGGIGSGKSAAAAAFTRLGVPVIDTDLLAREVVARGSDGLAEIVTAFGPGLLTADGALDRAAMRRLVFADAAARQRLEAITHPRIRALAAERVAALAGSGAPYCVLVVPLLLESGAYGTLCSRVLVIDVPPETQLERVLARDGSDESMAHAILAAQMPRAERLAAADDVLVNTGTLEQLNEAVTALDRRYQALHAGA